MLLASLPAPPKRIFMRKPPGGPVVVMADRLVSDGFCGMGADEPLGRPAMEVVAVDAVPTELWAEGVGQDEFYNH